MFNKVNLYFVHWCEFNINEIQQKNIWQMILFFFLFPEGTCQLQFGHKQFSRQLLIYMAVLTLNIHS